MYTNDPVADFLRHDAEMEERLSKRPTCTECREPIQTDEFYKIGSSRICPDCLIEYHRVWTEDYIEE